MVRPSLAAAFLFVSGACALVYEVTWIRELRLVFGASTSASAAVLAVFMGGLGFGGFYLGKRVERSRRNSSAFMTYANLELIVALLAAVTPLLIRVARSLYYALGGVSVLGMTGATIVRVILAALVLAAPTFAMGGTMPAAASAITQDQGRRQVALLYGANALGAVCGAMIANFVLLEIFGNVLTLEMTCLVNALVGLAARAVARSENTAKIAENSKEEESETEAHPTPLSTSFRFPILAAAITGFAFLLMELVWYRMLAPLLGGSSYTFGLILAIALLGVGAGGVLYAIVVRDRRATLGAFAATCALEALFLAIPYALGDRIAMLALLLRPLAALGFAGDIGAWTVVASVVVLPASIVAGYQFPLVIALFGSGRDRIARQVGLAYAANTAGAIAGSLAGGFGMVPALTAPGCWRASAILLLGTSAAAIALAFRAKERRVTPAISLITGAFAFYLLGAIGPTGAWRHSPIGAGRADIQVAGATINSLRQFEYDQRRTIAWEVDGVESSVALASGSGYRFIVNGKSDGDARGDSGTQIMSGLVGSALVSDPKRALVIGLGTGSTGGWLAALPSMERVDIVEIEPAIVRVARACSPVNQNVLENPKVHLSFGDARETLLTSRDRYDVIFSEPSNPYRAGISSLFTQEFYQASLTRLAEQGVFAQWLQAYETDGATLRIALVTMASVFPSVSIWETDQGDLLLVGSRESVVLDAKTLRARLDTEPYRSALLDSWETGGLEGFLAHHVATTEVARMFKETGAGAINTDDQNLLEYAFARSVGRHQAAVDNELWSLSRSMHADRPRIVGAVDWDAVESARIDVAAPVNREIPDLTVEKHAMYEAMSAYAAGNSPGAAKAYSEHPSEPATFLQLELIAESLATIGDESAVQPIAHVRARRPIEADAFTAILLIHQGKLDEAIEPFERAVVGYRDDPWPRREIMNRLLFFAPSLFARKDLARRLYDALAKPFSTYQLNDVRLRVRVQIAAATDRAGLCATAFHDLEPYPFFDRKTLEERFLCYQVTHDPLENKAKDDLVSYLDALPAPLAPLNDGDRSAKPALPPPPPRGRAPL